MAILHQCPIAQEAQDLGLDKEAGVAPLNGQQVEGAILEEPHAHVKVNSADCILLRSTKSHMQVIEKAEAIYQDYA